MAPTGVPDWLLYARAMVELPPVPDGLTRDEARVVDVLAANEAMVVAGDPLWRSTRDDYAARTPAGWTWAHLVGSAGIKGAAAGRLIALVPADLHGSFRHIGGVNMLRGTAPGGGLRTDPSPRPVPTRDLGSLSEMLATRLESRLGYRLPPRYREFLARTNGAAPIEPGVLAGFGFVVDQPFFGLGRDDRHQDLVYANNWFGDRFTDDFLAIGPVQGGLLAVKVRGDDTDSVWYWDDDDPRDEEDLDAADICARLLYRVADDVTDLWSRLALPASGLLAVVDALGRTGGLREFRTDLMGAWLPASHRAPWQSAAPGGIGDELLMEITAR
jgi:hypothetical protein